MQRWGGGAADKIWKKRNGRVVKLSPINKMAVWGDKMGRNMMQNTRATNGEYIFQLCKYGRNKLIYIVNKGLIKGERRQKSEKFCKSFKFFCNLSDIFRCVLAT